MTQHDGSRMEAAEAGRTAEQQEACVAAESDEAHVDDHVEADAAAAAAARAEDFVPADPPSAAAWALAGGIALVTALCLVVLAVALHRAG